VFAENLSSFHRRANLLTVDKLTVLRVTINSRLTAVDRISGLLASCFSLLYVNTGTSEYRVLLLYKSVVSNPMELPCLVHGGTVRKSVVGYRVDFIKIINNIEYDQVTCLFSSLHYCFLFHVIFLFNYCYRGRCDPDIQCVAISVSPSQSYR